jgi:hypothetical protein
MQIMRFICIFKVSCIKIIEEYVHKIIMSVVAPIDLKIQYNLNKTHYFNV